MYNQNKKSAFIAMVGLANVGKSSLLNKLVGQKISIVSHKPQTTRNKITGVLTEGDIQLIFFDLPGFHKRKNKLSDYMINQIKDVILDVDVCILVVEATNKYISKIELDLINNIKKLNLNLILVINKIDLLTDKETIIKVIDMYVKEIDVKDVIPISVKKNDGIDILLKEIKKYTKISPHFFSDEIVTDQMERFIVSEIIREKMLNNLGEEIPYGVAVIIESMKKRKGCNIVDIESIIYCERNSHKGIIIGKNGATLKRIASQARLDIEDMLQLKTNLKCWVKTKNNWRNDEQVMKNFGYFLK